LFAFLTKVAGPFPGPYANGSCVHRAALVIPQKQLTHTTTRE
jgi:hypothetical protein